MRPTQPCEKRTSLAISPVDSDMPPAKRSAPAYPRVDRILEDMDPDVAPIARLLRHRMRREATELRETVKWEMPCNSGRENVCYIAAHSAHVNLGFYRGAEQADPGHLLEGNGKGLGHVKIRSF